METTIDLRTQSIEAGYLAADYDGDTIKTETGYLAAIGDTIETDEGHIYHTEQDCDEYGYDEINDCYRDECNLRSAYARRGNEVLCYVHECIRVGSHYYHEYYLSDNDIIQTEEGDYLHIDDAYFWESDDCYHSIPEECNLWDYGHGPTPPDLRNGDKFGIGFEIEKGELPSFPFDKQEVFDMTGAALERDGSVSDGFELITPIYSLYSLTTDDKLRDLKKFIDVKNEDGAGGHINFSKVGLSDVQLLNKVRGFLPLIYSMYPNRVKNTYCQAKKVTDLIDDCEKYQSIRLRNNYIEFRIFSAVHSIETALFRLNLFRIIGKNLGASFFSVLTQLITEGTDLNTLFRSSFYKDSQKFIDLINRAIDMNKTFGTNRLNAATIRELDNKLQTIKTK